MSVLQRALKPYGFSVHADGLIPQIQLIGPGGVRVMVNNMTELWAEVERIQGFPADPLAPRAPLD
nr:hypothetical protein [uncultured Halomonas sp.]